MGLNSQALFSGMILALPCEEIIGHIELQAGDEIQDRLRVLGEGEIVSVLIRDLNVSQEKTGVSVRRFPLEDQPHSH